MRGPTFSRVFENAGRLLLRALQARDRPRGDLDLPLARSTTSTPSPSSTATTTSSAPTRSTTRWCSASTPSGPARRGKLAALRVPDLAAGGRPTTCRSRRRRTTSTPTTRIVLVRARLGARPTLAPALAAAAAADARASQLDFDVEYDMNFKQFRNIVCPAPSDAIASSSTRAGPGRSASPRTPRSASCGSRHAARPGRDRAAPKRLFLEGSGDYDILKNDILKQFARQVRYDRPVLRLPVEYIRYNYGGGREAVPLQPRAREHRLDGQLPGRRNGQRGRRLSGEAARHRRRRASSAATLLELLRREEPEDARSTASSRRVAACPRRGQGSARRGRPRGRGRPPAARSTGGARPHVVHLAGAVQRAAVVGSIPPARSAPTCMGLLHVLEAVASAGARAAHVLVVGSAEEYGACRAQRAADAGGRAAAAGHRPTR